MGPEEASDWFALAGVAFLFAQQAFNRWMTFKEKRRGGDTTPVTIGLRSERGALGNGTKALTLRLDRLESESKTLRRDIKEVAVQVARIEGRLEGR